MSAFDAPRARPLRILNAIDGLELAGAQSVLVSIARLLDAERFELYVANVAQKHHPALVDALAARSRVVIPFSHTDAIWDPRSLASVAAAIRRHRIDVVHTHLAGADVVGGLAARLTGRPVVSTLHSVVQERATYRRRRRVLANFATRRLADRIVAVSEAVKDSHVSELGIPAARVTVLHNVSIAPHALPEGFDADRKRRELGAGGRLLVSSVSRLSDDRDHETLVRAVALLRDRSRLKVAFVGDGARGAELAALARELAVDDTVVFLGLRLDALEILAASDVVCQPTLYEGLPVTVLDAMALGLPVVASSVPGILGLVEDGATGLLVAPRDAKGLAEALARCLDSADERRRLGHAAREASRRRYGAEEWIRGLESIYVELAGSMEGRRQTP